MYIYIHVHLHVYTCKWPHVTPLGRECCHNDRQAYNIMSIERLLIIMICMYSVPPATQILQNYMDNNADYGK